MKRWDHHDCFRLSNYFVFLVVHKCSKLQQQPKIHITCIRILQKLWILLKPQPICFSGLYIFSKETSNYQILQKMYKNHSPVLTLSHTLLWPKIIIMGSFTSFIPRKYNFWVHCIKITFVVLKMYFLILVAISITKQKVHKKGDYHSHFITERQQSDNFGFKMVIWD